jgi:hypothetical protein
MGAIINNLQTRIKGSTSGILVFVFKLFSGLVLGYTVALVVEQIFGTGTVWFTFVVVTYTMAFMAITKKWSGFSILILDLVCVLVGMLLRMYVMMAPGA